MLRMQWLRAVCCVTSHTNTCAATFRAVGAARNARETSNTQEIRQVRVFRQTLIDKYNDVDRIELYSKVSLLTIIVWSLYPIVWMFSVGTGGLGVSAESIVYSVLDVCSKCVFSFMIVNFNVYESAAPATAKEYV